VVAFSITRGFGQIVQRLLFCQKGEVGFLLTFWSGDGSVHVI
jgi:hypothetical protein